MTAVTGKKSMLLDLDGTVVDRPGPRRTGSMNRLVCCLLPIMSSAGYLGDPSLV